MGSITQKIWYLLEDDPSIKLNLHRNLINHRALAKYLLSKSYVEASLDSVISAIRRFEISDNYHDYFYSIYDVLNGSKISTRTNISLISLKVDKFGRMLTEVSQILNGLKQEEPVRFINSDTHMKIIGAKETIQKLVENPYLRSITDERKDKLAEIKIHLLDVAKSTKGVVGKITGELAAYDINLNEVISCTPELFLFVDEKNLAKTHDIMIKLCSGIQQ